MKKVAVLGSPGAGKTTFANALARKTGLPVVHLDQHFHAKFYEPHGDEWYRKVEELLQAETWIIDGNYSSTFRLRFAKADTIFFLDYPRRTSVARVLKRRIKHHRKHRPEMPSNWKERLDKEFVKHVWRFNKVHRQKIYTALDDKHIHKLIVFQNPAETSQYLRDFELEK